MALFPAFRKLPAEVQLMIWESAASAPRVITIGLDPASIRYAEPHPLLHACTDSRISCHKILKDRLPLRRRNKTQQELVLNLASDFFFVRTIPSSITYPSPFGTLKRVIVSSEQDYHELIRELHHDIEEFWVLFGSDPKKFQPLPASEFRRQCCLHHCAEYRDYASIPMNICPTQGPIKKSCPACLWRNQLDVPVFLEYGDFRATLDSSLPRYPTEQQIRRATYPVVSWIRRDRLEDGIEPSDMSEMGLDAREQLERGRAAACLLEGRNNCRH